MVPKGAGLLKVKIVLAPKGAIQNFIKNIRYDTQIKWNNTSCTGFNVSLWRAALKRYTKVYCTGSTVQAVQYRQSTGSPM